MISDNLEKLNNTVQSLVNRYSRSIDNQQTDTKTGTTIKIEDSSNMPSVITPTGGNLSTQTNITKCQNLTYENWADDFVTRIDTVSRAVLEVKDGRNCLKYLASAGYGDYDNKYMFKITWKPNTSYMIKADLLSTIKCSNFAVEYTDGTFYYFGNLSSANVWQTKTFITDSSKTVKYIRANYNDGSTYIDIDTFVVAENYMTKDIPIQQTLAGTDKFERLGYKNWVERHSSTDLDCTTEQNNALEELYQSGTYENNTYIYSTDTTSHNIECTYYKKSVADKKLQIKSLSVTTNGTSTITPDTNYDGISSLDLTVNVEGGGGGTIEIPEDNGAIFYDYDGKILHAFTNSEIQAMTSLPTLPSQEGLTCEGWNWTLDKIKQFSANQVVNVGAIYNTVDGKTRIYINLPEGLLEPCLYVGIKGTLLIDWGDGTTETATRTSLGYVPIVHEYSQVGQYIITLDTSGLTEPMGIYGSSTSIYGCRLLMGASQANYEIGLYVNCIEKIHFGDNVNFLQYAFARMENLQAITIPNSIVFSSANYLFSYTSSLKHINIPSGISIPTNAFQYCYGLENISHNATAFSAYAFQYCYKLNRITISTTQIADYCFRACYSLERVYIPATTTNIGYYVFYTCYALKEVSWNSSVNISDYNFYNCCSLKEFNISNSTALGANAFYGCLNFKKAVINANITTTPSAVFYGSGLAYVEFLGNITALSSNGFQNTAIRIMKFSGNTAVPTAPTTTSLPIIAGLQIVVPDSLYDEWKSTWTSHTNYIVKASEYGGA